MENALLVFDVCCCNGDLPYCDGDDHCDAHRQPNASRAVSLQDITMREGAYFFAHERQRIGEMKTLATPLGLAGPGSRSTTERSGAQFFDRRVAGVALSVALAYYLGAKIGFALTFQPHP